MIEHDPFLLVTAMNADAAKRFAMPNAFKVVCCGQAKGDRVRFGARVYKLFATAADYNRYLAGRAALKGET